MKTLYYFVGVIMLCLTSIITAGCEDYMDPIDLIGDEWFYVAEDGQIYDGGGEKWTFNEDGTFLCRKMPSDYGDPDQIYEGKYEHNSDRIKFWYPIEDENGDTTFQIILECKISRHTKDVIAVELVFRLPDCCEYTNAAGEVKRHNPLWPGDKTVRFYTQNPKL